MPRKPAKAEESDEKNNNLRQRHAEVSQLIGDGTKIREHELQRLLEESNFVSKVVEIYRRDALREFEGAQKYNSKRSISDFEEDFQRREEFLKKYLPNWLYHLIENLAMEAVFAAAGEPMLKSKISDLYNFIFVERGPGDPPLKDGRNEIWDSYTLNWAINEVLPKIKTTGNVTLAALAKKINALPKRGWLKKKRKALTGKHLQKLLKEHEIDWSKIKRDYVKLLEEKKRSKKTTKKAHG